MLLRTSLLAVTSALAATALIPSQALAFDQGNLLQSRSDGLAAFPGGEVNQSGMGRFAADQTGCRVVFQSQSDGLATGDNDRVWNVYVRDTCDGQNRVVHVSRTQNGIAADQDSTGSAISQNGRYVAFGTRAKNLGGTNAGTAMYRHDLQSGETVQVATGGIIHATPSVANTGAVAFTSFTAHDATNDSPGSEDVYVRWVDAQGAPAALELVSRGDGAAVGGTDPSISADGTAIGFTTAAPIAGAADTNTANDVYLRAGSTTTLISRTDAGAVGGRLAALDADGSAIAFVASATAALDAKDTNGKQDVYRWTSSAMTLVSRLTGGDTAASNGTSANPSISAAGDVVSFASEATDLSTAHTGTSMDVFRRDLTANTTEIMSRVGADGADFADGATTHALSGDGTHEVMLTTSDNASDLDEDDVPQIFARTVAGGALRHVNRPPGTTAFTNKGVGPATSREGATSVDGRFVAFLAEGNGLVAGDNDALVNVYVRDNQSNTTEQVNVSSGEQQPTTHATEAVISDSGRFVAFTTRATLSTDDRDASNGDVYVRDRQSGETILVSRPSGTGPVNDATNHFAEEVAISGDGRRVAFTTALKLADEDTNGRRDVYVRDLDANTTELATPGTTGEDPSFGFMTPVLDRDGSVVAFVTPERLDAAHDAAEGRKDVYARDLEADTTELVSRGDGATTTAGSQEALNPSISADGSRIAFESRSLVSPGANGQLLIHLRDRAQDKTLLVSRGPGHSGAIPNAAVTRPSISADGKRLVFQTAATNISNGETLPAGVQQVWLRNLETGSTLLMSRFSVLGSTGNADTTTPSLSANGRCVAFTSSASNLGNEHAAGDYTQVWLRAAMGPCPDATAPVTTIGGPEGPTQNQNPQFFLTANENGVTWECKVGDGDWAACGSPLALTDLDDGSSSIAVRGTDLSGNVEAPKTRSFTVDTRKPVLSWTLPIDSVTGDATPDVAWQGDEPVAVECELDGQVLDSCEPPLTLPTLTEGDHELTVRATDAAGNAAEALTTQFTVDLTGAVAEITSGPVGSTADTTPAFAFDSEGGATFRCGVDTTQLSACTSPWKTGALAEGTHVFRVQAIDPQGTAGPVVERTFVVDLPDEKPTPKPETGTETGGSSTTTGGQVPSTSGPRSEPQGGTGPAPLATLRLVGTSAKVKRGRVTLSMRCTGATCGGTAALTGKVGRKSILLGRARYSVQAGTTAKVTVKLTAAGRKALTKGKRVKATLDLGGGAKATLTVRG